MGDKNLIFKHFVKLALVLTLATLGCGLVSPAPNLPASAPVEDTAAAPAASVPSLTVQQLKNAQYQLGTSDDHTVVQLTDGKYQRGTDTTTTDYASVSLTDFLSMGDLNGDGINEAAAMVFENYGGSGDFGFVAIYTNVNGLPVFLTSMIIDDRPMINSIKIENGQVYLDAVIHGINDPFCCPALPTTRRYALVNNQLRLTNYTSATADGSANRMIEITSPVDQTESSGSVQVAGTVSVAPFENSLSYSIYDEAGTQLANGPVAVTAADPGGPGTFDAPISLAAIPAGTRVYLQIQDLSAADGSILALDSVLLNIK
jgi:Immunoglobulin-like domain of bacterial spore germination